MVATPTGASGERVPERFAALDELQGGRGVLVVIFRQERLVMPAAARTAYSPPGLAGGGVLSWGLCKVLGFV